MKKTFLMTVVSVLMFVVFSNANALDDNNTNTCCKNNKNCTKFIDANNDGVCDSFIDADGDGKCDNSANKQNCKKGKGQKNCNNSTQTGNSENCKKGNGKKMCGKNNGCTTNNTTIKINEIYPNPSELNTNIKFEVLIASPIEVQISDLSGIVLKTVKMGEFQKGNHEFVVDLTGLTAGNYYLSLISGNQRTSKQIVVK